jgi:hypothetical protein
MFLAMGSCLNSLFRLIVSSEKFSLHVKIWRGVKLSEKSSISGYMHLPGTSPLSLFDVEKPGAKMKTFL